MHLIVDIVIMRALCLWGWYGYEDIMFMMTLSVMSSKFNFAKTLRGCVEC